MSTFDLKGRKIYITGESYAGQYVGPKFGGTNYSPPNPP